MAISRGLEIGVGVLQYAGAHTDFRSLPADNINAGFGRRLLSGMFQEIQSRARQNGCNHLGLFVAPENPMRKRYRDDLQFQELDEEKDGDRIWIRMVRGIEPSPNLVRPTD